MWFTVVFHINTIVDVPKKFFLANWISGTSGSHDKMTICIKWKQNY